MSQSGYKPSARIAGLDIARGVAILGTLATNIWIFSHPAGMLGYLSQPRSDGVPAWESFTEGVLQQLANGKFLGVLTLMFGIGLAIQRDSALRRGRRWPGPYPWRAALLFLDAVLHYVLVVEFDILMGYAVTGCVVAYLLVTSRRVQTIWIAVCASVQVALVLAGTALLLATPDPGPYTGPNPYADGSWWDLVRLRLDNALLFRAEPVLITGLSIAMFLLGARLDEAGLFAGRGRALRRRLMLVGGGAFVLDLAVGLSNPNFILLTRYVLAPVAAFGLLALIAEVTAGRSHGSSGFMSRRLAEIGRTALSCYMLQNVVASVLFYGWGFGLNGVPATWRLPVTVAGWVVVSVVVALAAHLWLRRFDKGPVEWAWARGYALLAREKRSGSASGSGSGAGVVGAERFGEREQVGGGRHLAG